MIIVEPARAAYAGMLGGLLWIAATTGFALGEIEYRDPTRPSPIPEWIAAAALVAGALLIGIFVAAARTTRWDGSETKRARLLILVGAAITLVPLWPFIFLGPLLAAVGFCVLAIGALRSGDRTPGVWLHGIVLPLALPSGAAFDAVGLDPELGGLAFGVALGAGIVWRAYTVRSGKTTPTIPAAEATA